jgi:hypothetical protein
MYLPIPQGKTIDVQGLKCILPPEGYVQNSITGLLEKRDIYIRPAAQNDADTYWERIPLPSWWKEVMRREDEFNRNKKDDDLQFYDERYEQYKAQEWDRRLNGFWFANNGKPTYITGAHYLFMQWAIIDIGNPKFRVPDMEYFYFQQNCVEDPFSMGMCEITKRRFGKTYRGGNFVLDYPTRTKNAVGGIQSKTGADAKKVFAKAIVQPFKKMPRFFRPEYDLSGGITPKSELRFQQTNIRGKKAEESLEKDELGSLIDYQSADVVAYDGQKLHRYFRDEWAKCFAKGTKIRMYDGSIKNVEDIIEGDLVMGDDSKPRKAYGITSGIERMYKVTPISGDPFVCNESHILSLKRSGTDDIVNVSLRDYFKLSNHDKQHLKLWRVGVQYTERKHTLEPYFLGAWIGDGFSKDSGFSSNDAEVVEYMQNTANAHGLYLKKRSDYDYHISSGQVGKNNYLLSSLRSMNLLRNKHIPNEYLVDSVGNRLQLLAGLIDTDGSLEIRRSEPARYCITQKRKELAYQIQELARSCGFKATLYTRIATMARTDGSMYKCEVFKVSIYGELYKIPCRVKRKIAWPPTAKSNRNPLRSGFSIEPIGEGEYYGFAVGDNHLFLLADYTVAHNTVEVNVFDAHEVIRYCLLDDEGQIIGKALYSSTVEQLESEKDGVSEAAIQLWEASNQDKRGEDGRTQSGLYRFFMTADRARNFDVYGEPDVEKTIKSILADRATVKNNKRALAARMRKEARTIEEAFYAGDDKCEFNAEILSQYIKELEINPVFLRRVRLFEDKKVVKSPIPHVKDKTDRKIKFMDDEMGHWLILEAPDQPNNFTTFNEYITPLNVAKYAIGVDTFKIGHAEEGSQGTILVFKKSCVINGNETGNYPVALCSMRPKLIQHLYDEVAKACMWYGCKVNYEISAGDHYFGYYHERGFSDLLYWTPAVDPNKKNFQLKPGTESASPFELAAQLEAAKLYVDGDDPLNYNGNIHLIKFPTLLKQLLRYRHDKRTPYDEVIAFMMALLPVLKMPNVKPANRINPLKVVPVYDLTKQR